MKSKFLSTTIQRTVTYNYPKCKCYSFPTHPVPANFFCDISVRFLSWECWDFRRRQNHFRRSPKSSEDVRSFPKTSEVCRSLPKASSLPVLFTSKIRDREEGIAIYSFYTWFSFLTLVWVNIFLEIVSSRTATTHIFQSGVRNWPAGVSRRAIEVFSLQAWELAGIHSQWISCSCSGSGSGSAAVVSNCYQLAWIVSVSRVPSEVCDSRRWLKFKLDHSPLFSSAKLKIAIATVKVIWVSSDD